MRQTNHNYGWVENEHGELCGVALGYGFCAEHEWGIAPFLRAFDVDQTALGLESMRTHAAPQVVRFETWKEAKPPVSRRAQMKRPVEDDKLVEAALHISTRALTLDQESQTLRQLFRDWLAPVDLRTSWYEADRHDMATMWDEHEALIWVRGSENVDRLRTLHDAILAHDAVLNVGGQADFGPRRGGLSFGIYSRFTEAFKQKLLDDDLAARRLEAAVVTSGIRETLHAAGKGYHALSAAWINPIAKEGLEFFLNPEQQRANNFGWFTLEELQQWARNEGPVIKDPQLEQAEKAFRETRGESPEYMVVRRLNDQGLAVRRLRAAWSDDAHTVLGVIASPGYAGVTDKPILKAGTYAVDELLAAPDLRVLCEDLSSPPATSPARRRPAGP